MPRLMTMALASDNTQFLTQARTRLARERAVRIVGEAREAREAAALVTHRRPTLVLLDVALPPAGGLPILRQIRKRSPKTRTLVIDARFDEGRVLRVAKAGAHGYMVAEAVPGYLAKAVRVMAAGEVWFSRKLMGKVVDELQRLVRIRGIITRRQKPVGSRP